MNQGLLLPETGMTPRVEATDHQFFRWIKMGSLYAIWLWIATWCEMTSFWPLLLNDGGKFYNECYYMFYNGVVWYNAPKPYDLSA